MKKIMFILVCISCSLQSVCQFVCGIEQNECLEDIRTPQYIANGGVFTPKGDIRILIIFIKYGGVYDTMRVEGWDANADRPQWALSETTVFHDDYLNFNTNVYGGDNRRNISDFYYQMSNGLFRMCADYYPTTITLDPALYDSRGSFHKKVLEELPSTFDWSRYDNRSNNSYYLSDNSNTPADGIVDYIVFCHRFNKDWPTAPASWLGNIKYDGVSTTATGLYQIPSTNYSVNYGFSFLSGGMHPMYLFPHELGHELYSGPHYNGGNGVAGKYFYMPTAGWGMMNIDHGYTCALGWERYVLDWTPQIGASGIPSAINDVCDLTTTNGVYTLRDFITTGDALRIRVPAGDDKYQYLWLENHQGVSTFDGTVHGVLFCGDSIVEYKKGLVAYVEGYSHVKEQTIVNIISTGNAIRWLSRNGDYDFTFMPTPVYPNVICDNLTYPLNQTRENPIGGQNVNEFIRQDYNNDGCIGYDADYNSCQIVNESAWAVKIGSEEPTAKWINGAGMQFHEGDKVGIATNPTIKNMPEYNQSTCKMGDYYLNGISFEVLSENADGSITVKIRLDDVAVDRDVRWAAASIALTDITGDSLPDVDVMPNITLAIDRSGTPNRHMNPANPHPTSPSVEIFVTPTLFTCRSGSYFKQEPYSRVDVKVSSSLVIDSGAVYEVGDHAVLNVTGKSTLHVKRGATLRVCGAGHVEIGDRAYICIEDGANIHLVDTLSAVNLMPTTNSGVYAGGSAAVGNCTNTDLTQFPLQAGSKGAIHRHNNNTVYIQRRTYTGNAYVYGSQIYAGNNVMPLGKPGDVVVKSGAHVIWDATNGVHLEPGVRVEAGGALEVR